MEQEALKKPAKLTDSELQEEARRRYERRLNVVLSGDNKIWMVGDVEWAIARALGKKIKLVLENKKKRIYKVGSERDRQHLIENNEKFSTVSLSWERDLTERQLEIRNWMAEKARALKEEGKNVQVVKSCGLILDGVSYQWVESDGDLVKAQGGEVS